MPFVTLSEHDLAELLAQLNAAPVDVAAVAVVLVGTVTEGGHGLPLWHSLGGEPWILA